MLILLILAAAAALLAAGWFAGCLVLSRLHPPAELPAAAIAAPLPPLPEGFLFGAATSSHQLDGSAGLSDWSRFEEEPGRIAGGERSGIATGHRDRALEDVGLLRALGAGAYRFSLEWARLEPEEGHPDDAEWERVALEVEALRAAGVTPMLTLLHFTLPAWLAARGGALAPDFAERFGAFAGEAARRIGQAVPLWGTINEPNTQVLEGYVQGRFPPAVQSMREADRAFAALLQAHAAAVHAIRAVNPMVRVGPVLGAVEFQPASRWSLLDWGIARLATAGFDWSFLEAIRTGTIGPMFPRPFGPRTPAPQLLGTADWIGLNFYTCHRFRFAMHGATHAVEVPGPGARSDTGWEIHPAGLLALLRETWRRYRTRIYVTENGIADAEDVHRAAYLRAHLHAVARAVSERIPVDGYFHWSLLDNFEWAEGFGPRFGLYAVDYATLARTPRPSAREFRRISEEIRGRTDSGAA